MLLIFCVLLSVFGSFTKYNSKNDSAGAQLFLACIVGPFGVWIRLFLARFNGRGGSLKWIPFGTFTANILAVCNMVALATKGESMSLSQHGRPLTVYHRAQ